MSIVFGDMDARIIGDFLSEVGKGNVAGHIIRHIPGWHAANVESSQLGDISNIPGVVVIPNPDGIQLRVVSSSASDAAAGIGMRSVQIEYLDTSFDIQTEIVTLNGTTPVNTVATNIHRVQQMHTNAVGSNGVAVGNITLENLGSTEIYEYVSAGGNQSLTARFTVPNAKTAYLVDWHVAGMKRRINFFMRATVDNHDRSLAPGIFLFQDFEVCELSNSGILPLRYLKCPAQAEIKISAQAAATAGEASGAFTILLVDD